MGTNPLQLYMNKLIGQLAHYKCLWFEVMGTRPLHIIMGTRPLLNYGHWPLTKLWALAPYIRITTACKHKFNHMR